jgi:hypothetical protein
MSDQAHNSLHADHPHPGQGQASAQPVAARSAQPRYIDSEHYRQMLAQDGDRRFQEWHRSFLRYQRQFLQAMQGR